jgi:AcrR family transcriptional regulator
VSETQDWRARRWEDTHQRIYATAIRLFQEQGFEQVSVGAIAAGAEVSVPTFYAHYASKEHLVMQLPTAEALHALLDGQPAELPVADRLRRAMRALFASWDPEYRQAQLARWRVIATTPALRTRAAEFERTTAGMIADVLPTTRGGPALSPADQVVIIAYLSAYTMGMLTWADGNGERQLEEVIDEAFDLLEGR